MMPGWAMTASAVGATHEAHGGRQRQPPPVDPGGRAAAQEALEGLGDRSDVAAAPHGLTDVRPSDGAAAGDRGELVGLDRVTELPQALEDLGVAHVSVAAQLGELAAQLGARRLAREVAQQVDGHLVVLEVDLDARHDLDAELGARREGLVDAVDRVVVGDCHGAQADAAPRARRAPAARTCRPSRWCGCAGRSWPVR